LTGVNWKKGHPVWHRK